MKKTLIFIATGFTGSPLPVIDLVLIATQVFSEGLNAKDVAKARLTAAKNQTDKTKTYSCAEMRALVNA